MRFVANEHRTSQPQPGRGVTVVAWLMATWSVGFALVNLGQLVTNRFAHGRAADYAAGLVVLVWIVVVLKVVGAAVALLSVSRRPGRVPPRLVALLVWGAAALLGVYSLGNVVEAIGMLTGLMGSRDDITPAGLGYVGFFLVGAAGFGVLASSFSRRHPADRRAVVIGLLGAPLLLGLILLAIPMLLVAVGVMPDY